MLSCACAAALGLAVDPASAQTQRALTLGFFDPVYTAAPAERDPWLRRTVAAGAAIVRIDIGWSSNLPAARPAVFDAGDPADPAYDFSRADSAVVAAAAAGLRILATFTGAPRWAEGPDRVPRAAPGTWRPDPKALEGYGTALATRYSGRFPDPSRPGTNLPRVAAFQVWNEPNLDVYLTPQWRGGRTAAPAHYRRMLRAFYRGVKSVGSAALVVTAGTAPFGDERPGGSRIMPVRFVRDLLCLRRRGGRLRGVRCPDPARFDVLAHHPYSVGAPRRAALNDDDVSIADMVKLTRLLRAAERTGGALPRRRHRLWATEVSYDSSPPDPDGIPVARHARFLAESLFLLWSQGVDTVTWFQIRDALPEPSYDTTFQSGVFFRDGRAKPAQQAFRFPLAVERRAGGSLRVWGRAPIAGSVAIEIRTRSGWRRVRTLRVAAGGVFAVRTSGARGATLRARVGAETSPAWRVT